VDGRPQGRLLFRCQERDDSFDQMEELRLLAVGAERMQEAARLLTELATSERASVGDLRSILGDTKS